MYMLYENINFWYKFDVFEDIFSKNHDIFSGGTYIVFCIYIFWGASKNKGQYVHIQFTYLHPGLI